MLKIVDLFAKNSNFELQEINLTIEKSSCQVIIGENGAGKTTLIECILGFRKPTKGKIFFNNKDITDTRVEEREFAYIPQDIVLFPNLTVEENINLIIRANRERTFPREKILEFYDVLNLLDKRDVRVNHLSGGEKQKVAILRALVSGRKFLILDEPFSSLDPVIKKNMWQIIARIKESLNLTLLFVTHDMNEAIILGDNFSLMSQGRLYKIEKNKLIFLNDFLTRKEMYKEQKLALCKLVS